MRYNVDVRLEGGLCEEPRMTKDSGALYRGLSISPQHSDVPLDYDDPSLNLDELIAGRNRELSHLMDQTEFERFLRRQMNVA
jgi:hypothetical protein